jgi:hypothetical protein
MTIGLKAVLFLIATVIFLLDFLLAFVGAPYEPYRARVISLAWGLMALGLFLWAGGK